MQDHNTSSPLHSRLVIGLNAVVTCIEIASTEGAKPLVLNTQIPPSSTPSSAPLSGLPYGAFDPARHRTFEIGLRDFVRIQTNMHLGYVEQLYTFGDKGREAPSAVMAGGGEDDRIVSVGYLALATSPMKIERDDTAWRGWYDYFPWEDWRHGMPLILKDKIIPFLRHWVEMKKDAHEQTTRRARLSISFGLDEASWEEERTLDRYELMYEAGLVREAWRDAMQVPQETLDIIKVTGKPMASDHRRILATAIGRLRGKLRYRPVIFEMMPEHFTLLQLQHTIEAIIGFNLHKQNFRRSIENTGLVVNTGQSSTAAGGRPAALFKVIPQDTDEKSREHAIQGLALPRMRATE